METMQFDRGHTISQPSSIVTILTFRTVSNLLARNHDIFHTLPVFNAPVGCNPRPYFVTAITLVVRKLEW